MGALQTAYGYSQDLNRSLNDIRIVTGYSADKMADFAERANKAAQALSTTTTAYTDAALIFYQQGLSDEQVEARTNATIKMANVTGENAEHVSSYMTAIWNNFDNGSKSLEYYADVMTELGARTAASSEEIAEGMEKFAAVGNTVGLSYEYAAAAVTTVIDKTRQSADIVGTSFKTIFARLEGLQLGKTLEDGTDLNKYAKALAAVGVNIKDQNGELKQMDQILNEMGAKWQTLTKDQQVALAQTVGGVRQYTQLIALMENFDAFQKNVQLGLGSEGTLQEQQEIYAQNWEASAKRVRAACEALYDDLLHDSFFIKLNNWLVDALQTIDKLVDSLGGV
jgi:TP901 family phage tail tape measure protein